MAHHIELGELRHNERAPVETLCRGLPDSWIILTSVENIPAYKHGRPLGRGRKVPEVDCLIFGNSHIFVVELKAFSGPLRVYSGQPWEDDSGNEIEPHRQGKFGFWQYHQAERIWSFKDLLVDKLHKEFPQFHKKMVYGLILLTGRNATVDAANSEDTLLDQVLDLQNGIGQMLKSDDFAVELALNEKLTRAVIGTFMKKFPAIPQQIFDVREDRAGQLLDEWARRDKEREAEKERRKAAAAAKGKGGGQKAPPPPPRGGRMNDNQEPLRGKGTAPNSGGGRPGPTPPPTPTPTPTPPPRPRAPSGISARARNNHPLWRAMAQWGAMAFGVIGLWWFLVAKYCGSGSRECVNVNWFALQLNSFDLLFLGSASATYLFALVAIHRGTQ